MVLWFSLSQLSIASLFLSTICPTGWVILLLLHLPLLPQQPLVHRSLQWILSGNLWRRKLLHWSRKVLSTFIDFCLLTVWKLALLLFLELAGIWLFRGFKEPSLFASAVQKWPLFVDFGLGWLLIPAPRPTKASRRILQFVPSIGLSFEVESLVLCVSQTPHPYGKGIDLWDSEVIAESFGSLVEVRIFCAGASSPVPPLRRWRK